MFGRDIKNSVLGRVDSPDHERGSIGSGGRVCLQQIYTVRR